MMISDCFSRKRKKTWLRVIIDAHKEHTENIAAFLAEITGAGAEILSEETSDMERVIGYLPENAQRSLNEDRLYAFLEDLNHYLPRQDSKVISTDLVYEEDWNRSWKRYYKPNKITSKIVISPSWETFSPAPGELVMKMDPGMAFGTGYHASTRLALEQIEILYLNDSILPEKVLDVGTGTGILAMGCALLGAKSILAIDNDIDAVAAAQANVSLNSMEKIVVISDQNLISIPGTFDLITANITHDTLIQLCQALTERLSNSGYLILSGILAGEQEQSIIAAYESHDLEFMKRQTMDEWAAVCFRK